MQDSRFESRVDDVDDLLTVVGLDDLDDLDTLLMFLFLRPVTLVEAANEDGTCPSLEVILHADDGALGVEHEFPFTLFEVARSSIEIAADLGPYTPSSGVPVASPDLSALTDHELVAALTEALGKVQIFNMLDDEQE